MDSVIGIIRGKSSDYKAILQAVNDNIEVITHCASAISPEDTPLLRIISDLNTPEHAYGVALLLTLQSRNVHPQSSNSFSKNVRELFSNLQNSPKKQYEQFYLSAGREVSILSSAVTELAIAKKQPRNVIALLRDIIMKSAELRPHCLIPSHNHFLQACIHAQMYGFAVRFLLTSCDLLEVDVANTGISIADLLSFFYCSGICYLAVKDYPAAIRSFNQAISAPANSVSAIVVSCIKKARLVSLLGVGQDYRLPVHTSSCVRNYFQSTSKTFDDLVHRFVEGDVTHLRTAINEHSAELRKDNNLGLANQLEEALITHRIRKLTATYISMSLVDMARFVGLEGDVLALERKLVSLVKDNQVQVKIDQQAGMVIFIDHSNSVPSSSSVNGGGEQVDYEMMVLLQGKMDETIKLADMVRSLQKELLMSPAYIMKSVNPSASQYDREPFDGMEVREDW